MKYTNLLILFIFISLLLVISCNRSGNSEKVKKTNVITPYQPKDSIRFPHSVHAKHDIACAYCHNSKTESDRKELTINICTNCHKQVKGADANGKSDF